MSDLAYFIADTAIVVGLTIALGAVAFMLRETWKAWHRHNGA
jgi:hypothetical protein